MAFARSRRQRLLIRLLAAISGAAAVGLGYLAYRLTPPPGAYNKLGVVRGTPPQRENGQADSAARHEIIYYTSLRPANWDIYLFEDLHAAPRRLTRDPAPDYNATLSPDARWVVFTSDRRGNADLYALDLTRGGEPVPLTRDEAFDDAATFSPDGKTLAWVSTRGGKPDIYVMSFDPQSSDNERAARRLTDEAGNFNPRFSPDGKTIAFSSNRAALERWNPTRLLETQGYQTSLYTMGADGKDVRRVSRLLALAGRPVWSPDGAHLYYYQRTQSLRTGAISTAIYAAGADGRGATRITPDTINGLPIDALTPAIGRDGTVVFVAARTDARSPEFRLREPYGGRLYQIRPDGTGLAALGEDIRNYLSPSTDLTTGALVAQGDGDLGALPAMANGNPLAWPYPGRRIALADREVELRPIRAYFPSFSASINKLFAVEWVHESKGAPPGPSPIIAFDPEATGWQPIWKPDKDLAWGPVATDDGQWIYFALGPVFAKPGTNVDIWRVHPDGTGAANLTADSPGNDAFPSVSADGRQVVFRSGRFGDHEICLMEADGTNVRRVSHARGTDTMPAISPDGQWIAYVTARTGKGLKIWIQRASDGGGEGQLLEPARAHLQSTDVHPRFSPDGKWIVFASDRAGFRDEWLLSGMFPQPYGDLFAIRADATGDAVQLTDEKGENSLAIWMRPR